MRKSRLSEMGRWMVLAAGLVLFLSMSSWALTDSELIMIRDGFDGRRDQMLATQVAFPYPDISGVWGKQDFALAALYLNTQLDLANTRVIEACDQLLTNPDCPSSCSLHWNGNLFCRIYEYFNANSSYFPGRLTPAAEAKICEVLWFWAQVESKIADTDIVGTRTWWIWESENHDIMHDTTNWGAVQILKDVAPYSTYTHNDGYTVQDHYEAWTEYFKEYLRERAKRGLFIEIASSTYTKYTLQGLYNFYDFAEDEVLRVRGGRLLDLWWADWAHDQIDGVRGGGKARVYQYSPEPWPIQAADYAMCWYYLGIGGAGSKHPGIMCLATSTYRMPLVVMDIALDINGRGVYEYKSRRPGAAEYPTTSVGGHLLYKTDPDHGGIYRYSYCTPDFVLGTSMVLKREHQTEWTWISDQNRQSMAVFKGDVRNVIMPICTSTSDGRTNYNQHWSIQNKGTLIVQKLASPYSGSAGAMRTYFSSNYMTLEEDSGWVFADVSGTYAAVRPAWGGYSWDDAYWMRNTDEYAPVIIEMAQASDYMDMYVLFKMAVTSQTISVVSDVLTYTGLGGSGTFTFYTATGTTQIPELNGVPIDFEPSYTFDSPYMHEDWASGEVTISKDGRELVLNFNPAPACGAWDYYTSDIDQDCYVNPEDLALLAQEFCKPVAADIYVGSYGKIVIETEHYVSKTAGSGVCAGVNWVDQTGGGSMGDGYMEALPSTGLRIGSPDIEPYCPRLRYKVYFRQAGTYYLWVKGWGPDGNSDSIHYGLDGVSTSSGLSDCAILTSAGTPFVWTSSTGAATRPAVEVSSAGLHYFDVWMREDGSQIDRLVLTTDALYDPSLAEPAESGYGMPPDIDTDGDVDLADFAGMAGDWGKCTDPSGLNCVDLR